MVHYRTKVSKRASVCTKKQKLFRQIDHRGDRPQFLHFEVYRLRSAVGYESKNALSKGKRRMDKYMNANIAFSKFSRDYMALKKGLPIRPSEMGVLNIITKRDGMFTPLMIAELLGVSKSMIAAHISVLEKKGYIRKDYSPSDKRSFYVIPTHKAKELVDETNEKLGNYLKGVESKLGTDKFDVLVELLAQMQSIIAEENN